MLKKYTLLFHSFILLLTLVITYIILSPGLSGPFILDDIGNLSVLENFSKYNDYNWLNYLFAHDVGGLKRPVSFLSFLININDWPDNPSNFKEINLYIHFLNGILIFSLSYNLIYLIAPDYKKTVVLLSCISLSFLWLIHPFLSSTIFYVIQRMTELSALFMLLGLNIYIVLRCKLPLNTFKNFIVYFFLMGLCFILAVLSKENGILISFYLILIELFIINTIKIRYSNTNETYLPYIKLIYFYLPIILLVFYFLLRIDNLSDSYDHREFNLIERLLTESRILLNYQINFIAPVINNTGVFHDDYIFSTSLLNPYSTLLSLVWHFALLFIAFRVYKTQPLISFGIFWFYASHILESTFVPLELYYEHRNYLAFFGLYITLMGFVIPFFRQKPRLMLFFSCIYFTVFIFLSNANAKIWGNEALISELWANQHPYSLRAYQFKINYWINQKNSLLVIQSHQDAQKNLPDNLAVNMIYILNMCEMDLPDTISESIIEDTMKLSLNGKSHSNLFQVIDRMMQLYKNKECSDILTHDYFSQLLNNLIVNKKYQFPSVKSMNYFQLGVLASLEKDLNQAMSMSNKAYKLYPHAQILFAQINWLVSAGLYQDASYLIDKAIALEKNKAFYHYKFTETFIAMKSSILTKIKEK